MQAIGSSYQNFNICNNYSNAKNNVAFKRKPTEEDPGEQFAISAGALGVASLLLNEATEFLAKKLLNGKEFTSSENAHKVADSMLDKNKLKNVVQVSYINHKNKFQFGPALAQSLEAVANGQNAFYMDELKLSNGKDFKLAVAPETKPSLILHELGHAINASKGKFLRFLQKSRRWAMGVPTALMVVNGLLGQNNDGKKNFVEKNAGWIGFAAFLPTIVEEGMASLRGISAAKAAQKAGNLLGSVDLNILKRNYALAWGTYLLSGVGLGIAAKQSVIE
jgi:hypothetical protein